MKLELEISDGEIKEMLMKRLASKIMSDALDYDSRVCRHLFREAAREVLYDKKVKECMIEDSVSRAAAELAKKGAKLLVYRMEVADKGAD